MKRGNAVWYNIILFHGNVHYLNYISMAINICKWKQKEAVVFNIIFYSIVNTVRKIAVAEARGVSRGVAPPPLKMCLPTLIG